MFSSAVVHEHTFDDNNLMDPREIGKGNATTDDVPARSRLIGNSIAGARCDTLPSYMQLCGAQCRVSLHDRIQLVAFYSPACNRARVSGTGHWSTGSDTSFLPTTTNYAFSQGRGALASSVSRDADITLMLQPIWLQK